MQSMLLGKRLRALQTFGTNGINGFLGGLELLWRPPSQIRTAWGTTSFWQQLGAQAIPGMKANSDVIFPFFGQKIGSCVKDSGKPVS